MTKPTPKLCKAGIQLREQLDDSFPLRKRPDGWIGDARHSNRKSDHNPDAEGWVRALDVSADLGPREQMHDLANQLRIYARGSKHPESLTSYLTAEYALEYLGGSGESIVGLIRTDSTCT
jgi:hypothetical protein